MKRLHLIAVMFLCLLFSTAAQAQDFKITGESKVSVNRLVRLSAENVPEKSGLLWMVFPMDATIDIATTPESIFQFVAPPGKYVVVATCFTGGGDKKIVPHTSRVVVEIVGSLPEPPKPQPDPGPAPDPNPPVPPTPITKAWVVIIEETEDARNNRGQMMLDRDLVAYIQAKKWKSRIADKDVVDSLGKVPTDLAPYINRAKTKGIPYYCVVDQDGKIRSEGTVPDTASEFLSLLKKVGG